MSTEKWIIVDERERYNAEERSMMMQHKIRVDFPQNENSPADDGADLDPEVEIIFAKTEQSEGHFPTQAARNIVNQIRSCRSQLDRCTIQQILAAQRLREGEEQGVIRILVSVTSHCNGLASHVRDAYMKVCSQ